MNSATAESARPDKRGGRRSGESGTRAAILAAAQHQFAQLGYDRTTLRSVALEATVDQKLVAYFFGSKHALFVAATKLPFDTTAAMASVLGGDPGGIGQRLAHLILAMLEEPLARGRLVGLVRAAAAEPKAARMVRDLLTRELWAPIAAHLPMPRPELSVGLVASQLLGLVMARYIICAEPLASLPAESVAASIAPILQQLLAPVSHTAPSAPGRRK